MNNRVICPACGKSNRLPDDFAGATVVCLACGKRFAVNLAPAEAAEAEPGEQAQADVVAASDPDAIDMSDAAAPATATRKTRRAAAADRDTNPVARTVVVAAA